MSKLRLWIIGLLFNNDEKYMIARAIDDRCEMLNRIRVNERWVVKSDIDKDLEDYKKLKEIFSTDDWI